MWEALLTLKRGLAYCMKQSSMEGVKHTVTLLTPTFWISDYCSTLEKTQGKTQPKLWNCIWFWLKTVQKCGLSMIWGVEAIISSSYDLFHNPHWRDTHWKTWSCCNPRLALDCWEGLQSRQESSAEMWCWNSEPHSWTLERSQVVLFRSYSFYQISYSPPRG